MFLLRFGPRAAAAIALGPALVLAQASAARDTVVATLPPRSPLPSEAASAGITKFSFIAYGDTRGRHDGTDLQAEHRLVVESMLVRIHNSLAAPDPIRFVVQSGDAVQDGSKPAQLTVSYVPLVDRLTQEANVPYFLAVGNHDVGNAVDLSDPRRVAGLRNYLEANAKLIPAEGSPRRLSGYPAYAFGFGNTFFIALDSDIPDDTTQLAWLQRQLDGLDRKRFVNVVVFFHHPPFSSGGHGGAKVERQAASIREKWMPIFRRDHVQLLLTGHEHLFEHWVEHYSDAAGTHRIDEIVTGGGGAPLAAYTGEPDLSAYTKASSAQNVHLTHLARPSSEPGGNPFHYVVVHVDGTEFSVEVVPVDWGKGFAPYRSNTAVLRDPPVP